MSGRSVWIVGLLALALNARAHAQPAPSGAAVPDAQTGQEPDHAHDPIRPPADEPEPQTDSPRNSLARFFELTRSGDLDQAALFLDLGAQDPARGRELARRLRAVLDRYVVLDLSRISPLGGGDPHDELPQAVDEICTIPNPGGAPQPVRMVRRGDHPERWQFSRNTVAKIDGWYDRLEHRAILENAPAWLLRSGARGIPLWQWFAIAGLLLGAWLGGWLLARALVALLRPLVRRTTARWDDVLLERMRTPLALGFLLLLVALAAPALGLLRAAQEFVDDLERGGLFAVFFLALARTVDVGAELLTASPWTRGRPASLSLIPLGARVAKLFVLALGAVALLSVLGYPVASLLAGLGIGGLAIALAAQKTVENLFGAFSIGADQPFGVGDFVKVEDVQGTVEAIGLRSTRIRTLDRTLITVPNGKLAEMRLESFAARDRLRFISVVGLTYGTSAAQVQQVVAGIERVLREHPNVQSDSIAVFFQELGATSLRVEASAYFATTDVKKFQTYRQDVLLRIMAVVEQTGATFASPVPPMQPIGDPPKVRQRERES